MSTDSIYYVNDPNNVVVEAVDDGRDKVYAGLDYVLPANVEDLIFYKPGNFRGAGNALNNLIVGNNGSNTLYGLGGDDLLYGGIRNDELNGGLGNDSMAGGRGDDTYFVDSAGDHVIERAGEGRDRVYSSVTYGLSQNVEDLYLMGYGNLRGLGNALDNLIIGNVGDNYLWGGDGKDHLIGGDGNDVLDGGWDIDVLEGGKGDDVYYVNSFSYWRKYTPAIFKDTVIEQADEGHDLVYTNVGFTLPDNVEDAILTNGIARYADFEFMYLTGNGLNNVLKFNPTDGRGGATLYGGDGDDILHGGGEVSSLWGDRGNDQLYGGDGINYLAGGAGDDVMVAGRSRDTFDLSGADSGADRLIFKSAQHADQDRIYSFLSSTGAKIDLSQIDAKVATTADDAFVFVDNFTGKSGELMIKPGTPESPYEDVTKVFDVSGDMNGDTIADFTLHFYGSVISTGDFIM